MFNTTLNLTPKVAKVTATLFMASTAAFAALPAQAAQAKNVSVSIQAADLQSEAGVKRVYYRLSQAAENACQAEEGPVSLKQRVVADACVDQMMSGFVKQIKSRKMTAFHADTLSKTG
ncbi:MAG: UrcA family protein [Alphaproteobacteria bacterium]